MFHHEQDLSKTNFRMSDAVHHTILVTMLVMSIQDRYAQELYLDPSTSTCITAIPGAPMLDLGWSRGSAFFRGLQLHLLGMLIAREWSPNLRAAVLRGGCGKE